ncbi:hypothetical protein ACS5PN_05200 [Roseateles sp. NT4]|uniref:hypothetical protein n=1 Tax=Roseateles sp. NT4 TaxID=3453715 RepID=UPI003EEFB9B2
MTPEAAVDPNSGYVAGLFTRMKARGFAFVIRAADGGAEYLMPLGEDGNWPTAVNDQSVVIKLPPGKYTITQWITYATLTKEVMSRRPIANPVLGQPFTVNAGCVTHLGSYDVTQYIQNGFPTTTTHLRIQPRRATEAAVKQTFGAAYPNLSKQAFRCLLCSDTAQLMLAPS